MPGDGGQRLTAPKTGLLVRPHVATVENLPGSRVPPFTLDELKGIPEVLQ